MNVQVPEGTAAHYRSDIDSLRALAVLAVVANHLPGKYLPSGWLGVDVFFVISGFVVTGSILRRRPGSLGAFYTEFLSRRVKRLLPALIACVTLTSAFVWLLDPVPENSLKTGLAALFGASNIALTYLQLDYFASTTRYNAFTHTWSLGVEEQFYLVYPLLVYLLYRARGTWPLALGIGLFSAVSLVAFITLAESFPVLVYYMMPTRFWELGAGALTFLLCSRLPGRLAGWPGQAVSILAILGLLAIFFAPDSMSSLATVVAVVLTCVLLARSVEGMPGAVLEAAPVRYVGKISYSLYLWHWPVVSLGPLALLGSNVSTGVFLPLMFILAALSYHLLEKPLRIASWSRYSWRVLVMGASASLVAAFMVYSVHKSPNPSMQTFLPFAQKLAVPGKHYSNTCVVTRRSFRPTPTTIDDCTFPAAGEQQPTIWLQGDSHAGHLQGMLRTLYDQTGLGYHLMETNGVDAFDFPGEHPDKISPRTPINEEIEKRLQAGDVMVYARLYFKRKKIPPATIDVADWTERILAWSEQLAEKNVPLVVVAPLPIFYYEDIRDCLPPNQGSCLVSRAALVEGMSTVHRQLETVARRGNNLYVFDPFPWVCPVSQDRCSPQQDDGFIYHDADHLNLVGSGKLADPFLRFLHQEELIQGKGRHVRRPMRLPSGG